MDTIGDENDLRQFKQRELAEWTRERPAKKGLFLFRDNKGCALLDVRRWSDPQQGVPEGWYATPETAGMCTTRGVRNVQDMSGEWCDVTDFCRYAW